MSQTQVTEELIKQLKAEHTSAELHHLDLDIDGETFELVAKTPSPGEFDRWRANRTSEDPGVKAGANKLLVASCLVWPEKNAWVAMLQRKPGLADTFAGELAEVSGIARGARRKKL